MAISENGVFVDMAARKRPLTEQCQNADAEVDAPVTAMVTRAQAEECKKPQEPLNVPQRVESSVSVSQLIAENICPVRLMAWGESQRGDILIRPTCFLF